MAKSVNKVILLGHVGKDPEVGYRTSLCLLFVLAQVAVELDQHSSVARINQLFSNPCVHERVHCDLKGTPRIPDDLLIDDREILLRRKVNRRRVDLGW